MAQNSKSQKQTHFSLFHEKSKNSSNPSKKVQNQTKSLKMPAKSPRNITNIVVNNQENTNNKNDSMHQIVHMLEDTGGSTDNNMIGNTGSNHSLRQGGAKQPQQQQQSNLISAAHNHQQHSTSVSVPQKYHQQKLGGKPGGGVGLMTNSKMQTSQYNNKMMGQFSVQQRTTVTATNNSIKGRKLSPNTEIGYRQSATGSDSGVCLIVNQVEDKKLIQNLPISRQNANHPMHSYSSEYVNQIQGSRSQNFMQAKSAKQSRSSSLLRHRQQADVVASLEPKEQSEVYTARFAAINSFPRSKKTSISTKGGEGPSLLSSQSEDHIQKINLCLNIVPKSVAPSSKDNHSGVFISAASKKSNQQLQAQVARKSNISKQITTTIDHQQKVTQTSRTHLNNHQSSSSALIMKPPRGANKVSTKDPNPNPKKQLVSKPSQNDLTKKQRKSQQSVGGQLQRKPNAVANQKLMAQQRSSLGAASHINQIGIKSGSQFQQRGSSSFNRSKSPMNTNSQKYQSVHTDKNLQKAGATSSSITQQSQSRQSLASRQPQPVHQSSIVADQRNESGGTGELVILPQNRSGSNPPQRGSSSSSSRTNHRSHVVEEGQQRDQRNTAAASQKGPLQNSKSSFQLTFCKQTGQSSNNKNNQQQHKQTVKGTGVKNPQILAPQGVKKKGDIILKSSEQQRFTEFQPRRSTASQMLKARELDSHQQKTDVVVTQTNHSRQQKGHAVSHSPRDRQSSSFGIGLNHKGDALRLFKVMQKQIQSNKNYNNAAKSINCSQQEVATDEQPRPYLNMLSYHSKSVANIGDSRQQNVESSTIQSSHDSVGSVSQSQKRLGQLKMMKKLLTNYQRKVIQPAQERLSKKKRGYYVDRQSHSPVGRQQVGLLSKQPSTQGCQSKKEKREQRQRVKDLRVKRKAIEAKTREMKIKSTKNANPNQIIPTGSTSQVQQASVAAKASKRTDLQQINTQHNSKRGGEASGIKTPSTYTVVRSNAASKEKCSQSDLLNAVGFQKHQNMPLQLNKPARQGELSKQMVLPRDRSTSSDRVEWDPIGKNSLSKPFRYKMVQPQTGKSCLKSGSNLRPNKREDIGLDYLKVKRELAMELPMAAPKKIKTVTPTTAPNQIPREKNLSGATNTTKKKVQQIASIKNERNVLQPVTLEPRILESERYTIPQERLLRQEELQSKLSLKKHPQTLDVNILESDSDQQQPLSKEKQRKLVEQQKRQWIQKERHDQRTQINEQQRILKNLQHVNKVARSQAQKAVKLSKRERIAAERLQQKTTTSARGVQGKNRVNYHVEHLQESPCSDSVSEEMAYSASYKKDIKRDLKNKQQYDSLINVQICKYHDGRDQISHNNCSSDNSRVLSARARQAYSSPLKTEIMQPITGATGAADTDLHNYRERKTQSIKKNAARNQERQRSKDERLQLKLNPATLYQLPTTNDGITFTVQDRQSSLSQRQSMSHSSNFNYSPTTTIEKRSNSQTTTNRAGVRSESPSKSRCRSNRSRHQSKIKSTSSKRSSKRKQFNQNILRQQQQRKDLENKRKVVHRFTQNQKIIQIQQKQRTISQDLDSEDLVIYIILTQAARMIQKAFRSFMAKKWHQISRKELRSEVETELIEARSSRSQLKTSSIDAMENRDNSSKASDRQLNSNRQFLSNIPSITHSQQSPMDLQERIRQENNAKERLQQRKHTFSFGHQNLADVHHKSPTVEPQNQYSHQLKTSSLLGSNEDGRIRLLDRKLTNCNQANDYLNSHDDDQKQPNKGQTDSEQHNTVGASDTANFEQERNMQLDLNKFQQRNNRHGQQEQSQQDDSDREQDFISVDNQTSKAEEDSFLCFEKVYSNQPVQNHYTDESNVALAYEEIIRDQQPKDFVDIYNQQQKYQSHQYSQEGDEANKSLIIGDAGEDLSLQNISDDDHRKIEDESMIGSVAERTDNIINYSGALNTSEEFIENQVNASGTLGPINPYSIVNSASKPGKLQQKTSQQMNAANSTLGKSKAGSDESSFEYSAMLLSNQYNLDNVVRKNQKKQSDHHNKHQYHSHQATDQSRKSLMRMISGDERFLNNYNSKLPSNNQNEYTNTETQKEALQIISQLNSGAGTNVGNQSIDDYQIKTVDNSFQNALYPQGMQSSLLLQQNLSQVSIEQEESKDSTHLLKQYGSAGFNQNPYSSTQQSYFLQTNASIFERNPFQDFTASKINALINSKNNGGSISSGSMDFRNVEQLVSMKEDALKYITHLEKGWIARQEKMSQLSPKQSNKKRYELEQWVTSQRKASKKIESEFNPSATQIKHFCKQVGTIVETVNRKADEIREKLYQRSQNVHIQKQQVEGYQEMDMYKKALGISGKSGEIRPLDNIDVIDQSQEEIKVEEQIINQESNLDQLDISVDESQEGESQIEVQGSSQYAVPSRLNSDILPTPPSDNSGESIKSNENNRLSEEITDRILGQLLSEEIFDGDLAQVFQRMKPRTILPESSSSPGGSRVRSEPILEVAVMTDQNFNINQSISVDQIIAGVDTSLEAVEQYVEGIFSQIRVRAKQFMNAFYTPIYRNPLTVLTKIQKQGMSKNNDSSRQQQLGETESNGGHMDLANTLSSILNVQLYLTLEKARENVIRDALQQIKDAATDGEDLAIDSNLSELLSESDHIHNKAIFDAVNESLNMVRPYGKFGEPMPWSSRPRKNFFPYANENDLDGVLQTVKKCILEWADIKAGQVSSNVLVKSADEDKHSPDEKDDPDQTQEDQAEKKNEAGVIRQAAFKQLSEETIVVQREKALAKLLTQEIRAQEEKWLDYEAEETQVKVDLSDHLLEHLVEEIVNEIASIQQITSSGGVPQIEQISGNQE